MFDDVGVRGECRVWCGDGRCVWRVAVGRVAGRRGVVVRFCGGVDVEGCAMRRLVLFGCAALVAAIVVVCMAMAVAYCVFVFGVMSVVPVLWGCFMAAWMLRRGAR